MYSSYRAPWSDFSGSAGFRPLSGGLYGSNPFSSYPYSSPYSSYPYRSQYDRSYYDRSYYGSQYGSLSSFSAPYYRSSALQQSSLLGGGFPSYGGSLPSVAPSRLYMSSPSYAAPVSSYVPPASNFSSAVATTAYGALEPATAFGTFGATPYGTHPYGATAYGTTAPFNFAPRSYGAYTPYSPFASGYAGAFPYSAYSGLEQPLELPTLALPAPPGTLGGTTLGAPFTAPTVATAYGSTFPGSLPAWDFPPLPSLTPAADAPADTPADAGAEALVKETVEVEPLPQAADPWAPVIPGEEFDLEYSRQVAARRVIGEEE